MRCTGKGSIRFGGIILARGVSIFVRGNGFYQVDWCRSGKAGECRAPECFCGIEILRLKPADILLEGARLWEQRRDLCRNDHRFCMRGSVTERLIEREQLSKDRRGRPAVEGDVVKAPDKAVRFIVHSDQGQPHQRGLGEIKATRAVIRQELGKPLFLLV